MKVQKTGSIFICFGCGKSSTQTSSRERKYCTKLCASKKREESKERPIRDRLLENISKTQNGCWEWSGTICKMSGYGRLSVKNRSENVHVLSYKEFKGRIKHGLLVCHSCDNRKCISPEHLWLGTHGDNNRDAASKGRSHGFKTGGESNAKSILTNQQAREMRDLHKNGLMQKEIAKIFNVKKMIVSNVITGKTYRESNGAN